MIKLDYVVYDDFVGQET